MTQICRSKMQMTDDSIQSFIVDLVNYLEDHPALFNNKGEVTDEGYDYLSDFIFRQLEPYYNGYMNCN